MLSNTIVVSHNEAYTTVYATITLG